MLPILHIGPLALRLPGLILLLGLWLASATLERQARRHDLPSAPLSTLVLIALVAGVIGARFWYALRYLDIYLETPLALFSLNANTLAIAEGVLTGVMAALIYGQRKALPFWRTLDAFTPGLAVMLVSLPLANLASGNGFGAPTALPWAIDLWGAKRHPSQIYEALAALLILAALWRGRGVLTIEGGLFLTWAASASLARLFLEGFRGDSALIFGVLRQVQLFSLLTGLTALWWLHLQARRSERH